MMTSTMRKKTAEFMKLMYQAWEKFICKRIYITIKDVMEKAIKLINKVLARSALVHRHFKPLMKEIEFE